ncbi:hypothetical protein [Deinococcus hohokamensis]|uniref:Uncharacterized protein n=1 Tax=Deinococcus hohokamensis TaxID=309883 RepID=A0ABV9I481_9DEIO
MPFLFPPPPAPSGGEDPVLTQGRHEARALVGALETGQHVARGGWLGYATGTHAASVRLPEQVQGRHLAIARVLTQAPADLPPVEVIYGTLPLVTTASTNLGDTLSLDYNDDGSGPTATVTVDGEQVPSGSTMEVTVTTAGSSGIAGRQSGPAGGPLPRQVQAYDVVSTSLRLTLELDDQYEVDETRGLPRTTFRGYSKGAVRLNTERLPELVSFMLSPTPRPSRRTPCSGRPKPQTADVSAIVAEALQRVGVVRSFGPHADPLAGQKWTEGDMPYSTRGKSALQVVEDTYGAIGWRSIVQVLGGRTVLMLLPPGGWSGRAKVNGDAVQSGGTRRVESGHTPANVLITGVDYKDELPKLQSLIQLSPDPVNFEHEVFPNIQWKESLPSPDGSGEIINIYNKAGGVIAGVASLTLQDVTVREQVDGKEVVKPFGQVLMGYETTESTYDERCKDMLLFQRTRKRSWGYTVTTAPTVSYVGNYGFNYLPPAGDPLGDEIELITQVWSPEGWLQSRMVKTRKLSSVKQTNPEGPLAQRGKLEPYEYIERIRIETYRPDGTGWMMEWLEGGGQPITLFDADNLDAVRLVVRGGVVASGRVKLDAAPPMVKCPDPCATRKRTVPNVVRLFAKDGKQGQELTRNITWSRNRGLLASYARANLEAQTRRTAYNKTLLNTPLLAPGTLLEPGDGYGLRGIVQSFGLRVEGGVGSVSVTTHEGIPTAGLLQDIEPDDPTFRDIVLWREVGGVTVQHFTGKWNGNVPVYKNVFVVVAGTQYPQPLDELEWIQDPRYGATATGNYGQDMLA